MNSWRCGAGCASSSNQLASTTPPSTASQAIAYCAMRRRIVATACCVRPYIARAPAGALVGQQLRVVEAEAAEDEAAVAARGAVADGLALDDHDVAHAALDQADGRGQAREAAADHAHLRVHAPAQRGTRGRGAGARGVVGAGIHARRARDQKRRAASSPRAASTPAAARGSRTACSSTRRTGCAAPTPRRRRTRRSATRTAVGQQAIELQLR